MPVYNPSSAIEKMDMWLRCKCENKENPWERKRVQKHQNAVRRIWTGFPSTCSELNAYSTLSMFKLFIFLPKKICGGEGGPQLKYYLRGGALGERGPVLQMVCSRRMASSGRKWIMLLMLVMVLAGQCVDPARFWLKCTTEPSLQGQLQQQQLITKTVFKVIIIVIIIIIGCDGTWPSEAMPLRLKNLIDSDCYCNCVYDNRPSWSR